MMSTRPSSPYRPCRQTSRCPLSEILFSLGLDLTTSSILDLGRVLMRQVRPEQQNLLRRTLRDAVDEAADRAATSGEPSDAFKDVATRPEVLDSMAALALASTPTRRVDSELERLFEPVDWGTSNVDRVAFFEAVVPAAREAVQSAGRSGGPLASLALNLRLDEMQRQLGTGPIYRSTTASQPLPPLPKPIIAALEELSNIGDARAAELRSWLATFEPVKDLGAISRLISDPPEWLNGASGRVWRLLGELADAHDEHLAAADAFQAAAAAGARNGERLLARAAYLRHTRGLNDDDLLDRLGRSTSKDPLVAALLGATAEAWADVLGCDPNALVEPDDRRLLQTLHVVAHTQLRDWNQARELANMLHEESPEAAGIALLAGRILLAQSESLEGEQDRHDALTTGLRLALSARDSRRVWWGPSGDAVEVAAQAAVLLHDYEFALKLCLPSPDGQATSAEASHLGVRATAAHLAALTGRLSIAKDLSKGLKGAARHLALAAVAESEGQSETAVRHARAAIQESGDGTTRRQALLVLAGAGALEQTDVADLPAHEATQLLAISLAESGQVDEAYALLRRSGGPETARYEHLNAILLGRAGDYDLAANRLIDAASKFGDPTLRVQAARFLVQAGDWEAAVEQCLNALAQLEAGSPTRVDAHRLLIEGYAERGEWPLVERYARSVLQETPSDVPTRWVLALALTNRRKSEEAWNVLGGAATLPDPSTPWQAQLLIQLLPEHEPTAETARRLLDLADAFSDDERVRAQVITALVGLPNASLEADDRLVQRAQGHTEDFLRRFPESQYFQAIDATDEDTLVDRLGSILKPAAERWLATSRLVAAGAPAGLLSAAARRPYASLWPHRAPGHLPITSDDSRTSDADEWVSRTPEVVLDASVLHTLALLPEVWPHLRERTKELVTTEDAALDVTRARESMNQPGEGTLSWNLQADLPLINELDPGVDSMLRERIAQMASGLRWTRIVPWRTFKRLTDMDQPELRPWTSLVDYCSTTGQTFYCDDVGLRRFARAHGVQCFDTTALLDHLEAVDGISKPEADRLRLRLASEFAVDLADGWELFDRLFSRDGWESLAAPYLLSRPAQWTRDVEGRTSTVRQMLTRLAVERPDLLPRWSAMSAIGISRATNSRVGETLIVEQLLAAKEPEVRAQLYFAARSVAVEMQDSDPTPRLVDSILDFMAGVIPPDEQAQAILWLFSSLPDADRLQVADALLRSKAGTPSREPKGPPASRTVSTVQAQSQQARSRLAHDLFGGPDSQGH